MQESLQHYLLLKFYLFQAWGIPLGGASTSMDMDTDHQSMGKAGTMGKESEKGKGPMHSARKCIAKTKKSLVADEGGRLQIAFTAQEGPCPYRKVFGYLAVGESLALVD